MLLCPRNINLEHTSDHISRSTVIHGALWAPMRVCVIVYFLVYTQVCVRVSIDLDVSVFLTCWLMFWTETPCKVHVALQTGYAAGGVNWDSSRAFSLFQRATLSHCQTGPSGCTEWNWLMKAEWPPIPHYDNSDDWFHIQWKSCHFLEEAD